jgi:hypothetical protein
MRKPERSIKPLSHMDPIEIQAAIDHYEATIAHDELPPAYDALVWWRNHVPANWKGYK